LVKAASEWDTQEVGNLQADYVEHCGRSNGGDYVHTLSLANIARGWWEGEPIPARTRHKRLSSGYASASISGFRKIHPDNDGGVINVQP
jgi:hypothetical protein